MKKVLVILGPTATGKTDVALSLAKKFTGELVSCDSRQVYRGLDIGTGKQPNQRSNIKNQKFNGYWKMDGVKVWMYDVADPKLQFTVKYYIDQATKVIDEISKRGKLPVIVGGTGLYLKALLDGLPNLSIPFDKNLRGELEKLSLEDLQNKLMLLSPIKWESLNDSDRKNKRRLLRSIEIISMNPYRNTDQKLKIKSQKYNALKIGLTAPREVLNQRIDLRLISRLDQGLIEEAKRLHQDGLSLKRMKELGLEYGALAELLEGRITQDEFVEKLKNKIHQYAKRQITWFKKEKNVYWFDITAPDNLKKIEKLVSSWYYKSNDPKS